MSRRGARPRAARALALAGDRLLAAGVRRAVPAAGQASDPERDRDPRAVRALARSDPGLCRHRLAGPRRLLRLGAYAAGLFCQAVTADPLVGLRVAIASRRCSASLTSFLVLRGSDLTRLMVTLGVALVLGEVANALPRLDRRRRRPAGHDRRAGARPLRLRPLRPHRLRLQPDDAVRAVPAGAPDRPFAVRPVADGDPAQSAARGGARRARQSPPGRGLHARRRLCRRGRRAAGADHRLSSRSTCSSSIARPMCCWC